MQHFFLSITSALPNQHILFFQWKDKFQSALDIGAGKGRHSFFFAENGLETTSVDLSESSLTFIKRKAVEKGLNIHTLAADMACHLMTAILTSWSVSTPSSIRILME